MGHLINATAMRVGWFSNWSDSWFSEFLYYPEFLYELYRMRVFLIYFFTLKRFEKTSVLYSHFIFSLKSGSLFVRIFFYDAFLFIKSEEYFEKLKKLYWKKSSRFHNFRGTIKGFVFATFFFRFFRFKFFKNKYTTHIFRMIMEYIIFQDNLHIVLALISKDLKHIRKKRSQRIWKMFKKSYLHSDLDSVVKNKTKIRPSYKLDISYKFLFMFVFIMNSFLDVLKSFGSNVNETTSFYSMFFRISVSYLFFINKFYLTFMSKLLTCVFGFLVPNLHTKTSFFLLSNDSVTSKFLARFIGIRLGHGYSLKELVNPIIKELKLISFLTKEGAVSFFRYHSPVSLYDETEKSLFRKDVIKSFIVRFSSIYKKYYLKSYTLLNSFVNFYLFSFLFWVNSFYNRTLNVLIGFSKSFIFRKPSFILLFKHGSAYLIEYLNVLFADDFFELFFKSNLHVYLFKIFDDIYASFNTFFFSGSALYFDAGGFLAANVFFNKLLTFTYWKHNYKWLLDVNQSNKRNLRWNNSIPGSSLLGYKIHCRGRFSRKQRASSVWFKHGKVPLNTLSTGIDYAFYATPLRNSLVSIKIWLNKTDKYMKWFVRFN